MDRARHIKTARFVSILLTLTLVVLLFILVSIAAVLLGGKKQIKPTGDAVLVMQKYEVILPW